MIYNLNRKQPPELSAVGGKAQALITATAAGFNVPGGFVLSTDFFSSWREAIRETPEWRRYKDKADQSSCDRLKAAGRKLRFSSEQAEQTEDALKNINSGFYAVRSSSPQEDLENTGFAGLYDTVLGVTKDRLEDAVRNVFLSAFDYRVTEYKTLNSIPPGEPKMAVIIQEQIAAELSGVAFSLNPVSNNYDETVINANFGLGESVVDGRTEPDTYTVDRIKKTITGRQIGSKTLGIWLSESGGTFEKKPAGSDIAALPDDRIHEVAGLAAACEKLFGRPQDIEWSYKDKNLYLLQSRPVTGYIKLPEEFTTKPGEQKILYQDGLLTEQGLVEGLSPLGEGVLKISLFESMKALGPDEESIEPMLLIGGGRFYANLGNMIKLTGRKLIVKSVSSVDIMGSKILDSMDLKPYIPKKIPMGLISFMFKSASSGLKMASINRRAYKDPDTYLPHFLKENRRLAEFMEEEFRNNSSLDSLCINLFSRLGLWMSFISLPTLTAALSAKSRIKKMFGAVADPDRLILLERAFPHNVTIEMGNCLYKLSRFDEIKEIEDGKEFSRKLAGEDFSEDFLSTWRHFIRTYGFRCPREMDIATPRYSENPVEIFSMLKSMHYPENSERSPEAIFTRGIEAREQAHEYFLGKCKTERQKKLFKKRYKVMKAYTAYREIHKYYMIMAMNFVRRRILDIAEDWVDSGRIDSRNDIFQLKYEEVLMGLDKPEKDLKPVIDANRAYYAQFSSKKTPPSIIDSRGYIPRLTPEKTNKNELTGTPASPGIATGRVKVLKTPKEKLIMPGDILITEATDPGWTPLFINAEGVLIQNGGTLQHGASVARESCRPCIVGVHNLTDILKDGQLIEMDGSSGIIRILET